MAIPGFTTTFAPVRERYSGSTVALNGSVGFEPALDGACVQNCQVSWSECINNCQWWEWAVGYCVPKCRAGWIACVGGCG